MKKRLEDIRDTLIDSFVEFETKFLQGELVREIRYGSYNTIYISFKSGTWTRIEANGGYEQGDIDFITECPIRIRNENVSSELWGYLVEFGVTTQAISNEYVKLQLALVEARNISSKRAQYEMLRKEFEV